MNQNATYTLLRNQKRVPGISFRQILLIYLILNAAVCITYAQDYQGEYDEILVYLYVPGVGAGEVNSVIRGEELFLPVKDIFDFLRIKNVPDSSFNRISGFFIDPNIEYVIDRIKNNILFDKKSIDLDKGALIRTETNLYLRCDYFGKIFGLNCEFRFRDLSVVLKTNYELPVIRELKREEMRLNLTRLKGEIKADTIIPRKYPMFHFGMADWSVIASEETRPLSSEEINNPTNNSIRGNLILGSILAGGETTVNLNYDSRMPFTEKHQFYRWRYVNNENKLFRQFIAGKLSPNATSSIYNPVIGFELTNSPTTFRKSFGTYTLTDKTEPDWTVELYVNNVLIDYTKADASGFFTFEVPLVYGNTNIRLKFYGPWGEERSKEQNITIPFNFLPKNTFEYKISAGFVEDTLLSRFSRSGFGYGVNNRLTIGGGLEYLSSVRSWPAMPYMNAAFKLTSNILVSGEYMPKVKANGRFSLVLPSNLQFNIDYTKYDRNQKAINYNYLEERKVSLSIPLKSKNLMIYNRLAVDQIVLPLLNYTTGEWMISGSVPRLSTSLSTVGIFMGERNPYVFSHLSVSVRLPAYFSIIPQAQYSYTEGRLLSARMVLEKQFGSKAFLNMSYERNVRSNLNLAEIGFRYDFNFAQAGGSARTSGKSSTLVQYARGSLINNYKTRFTGADNRNNVGRGGISFVPFLDINANGVWDKSEPKIDGFNLHSSMGRLEKSDKDTVIRVFNLEPYTDSFIEFDQSGFDNIAWRIKSNTMKVAVDPNMLKLVEVPVMVASEASGMIEIAKNGQNSGLERMIVNLYSNDNKLVGSVLSEDDGYFSYFGLTPGRYTARLDTAQLRKLGMLADTNTVAFNVRQTIDGDYIEGLDFTLRMKSDMPEQKYIASEKHQVSDSSLTTHLKDTSFIIVHEGVRELLTITEDSYALQLGAFLRKDYAEAYRMKLQGMIDKKIEVVLEDGFYKLRIVGIKDRQDADRYIAILKEDGISQVWLLSLKAMSQQLLITEKRDTLRNVAQPSDTSLVSLQTGSSKVVAQQPADSDLVSFNTGMSIQVGAFRNEAYAIEFRDKLALTIDKEISIVKEDGWNKVRISGFTSSEDLEKYLPSLGLNGIRDMWIVPVKTPKPEQLIAEKPGNKSMPSGKQVITGKQATSQKPVFTGQPSPEKEPTPAFTFKPGGKESGKPVLSVTPDTFITENREKPVVVQPLPPAQRPVDLPDSTRLPPVEQPATPVNPPEPTISLQVALFDKRAPALRAQKKITEKLALPVEIIEQWGYYRVIVTGFYTREETYRFYPELAGLGYPNITLIEAK
jgi:hypothetical protein